ncbi:MAG TPA: potassium channel protein [Bryobacteraceae bacterium]|nr:potassium channel protein [Bryobacteraceae bacterium]
MPDGRSESDWLRFKRRVLQIVAAIAAVICVGCVGYMTFAHYPLFEAAYMALTTITTIGYGEVLPLGAPGRTFNMFYIVIGVATVLVAFGVLTQAMIELELSGYFQKRRRRRMIENLKSHFIVCGYGRVGRSATEELRKSGVPILVVDRNEERVDRALQAGLLAVAADSTRDEVLREAGIERARGLIAALSTDADNTYLILSAKALNPLLPVATRVSEEESERKLRRAGADVVFAPYTITGQRLSQSLLKPHVNEFIDFTTGSDLRLDVRIEQVQVSARSEYVSKSLRQAQLRAELGVIVLAIRRMTGQMIFNPPADAEIGAGDYLIVMGPPAQLRRLEEIMEEKAA